MSKNSIGIDIERLLRFALEHGLIEDADLVPSRNALLDLLAVAEPYVGELEAEVEALEVPSLILDRILDYAADAGLLPENNGTYRDLLDARIMGLLMPRASETNRRFWAIAADESIERATDYFYRQSIASNYIRMDRVARNQYWLTDTPFGKLEITINLSKPEKDPKEIALLKNAPSASYPRCVLCEENVGYAGRINHPARQNHRIIPLKLGEEPWFFQYSPYVYYNEHSIVLHKEHIPMKITPLTFRRLLEFIKLFPHYFIGSNADLPIVGGSILSHEHYQAGRHRFAMELAPMETDYTHASYVGVKAGVVVWPLSVVRLRSRDEEALLAAAAHILAQWREYSDESLGILAYSGGNRVPHNTITPIARMNEDGEFELDLVLRNNRTDEAHPYGIFHPGERLHHIKKENIGLIEVMGLAVLPGRLKKELASIQQFLTGKAAFNAAEVAAEDHPLRQHADWISALIAQRGTNMSDQEAEAFLREQVGRKFMEVLTDCGVFKRDKTGQAGFSRFLNAAGFNQI